MPSGPFEGWGRISTSTSSPPISPTARSGILNTAGQGFERALPAAYQTGALPQDANPIAITAADVDGDSDMDLLVVNTTAGNLAVFYKIGGREAPLDVLPPVLAYGELCVDEDSTQTVQVRNNTNHPVSVDVSVRPDAGVYFPDTAALVLEPGESGSIAVRFTPLAAEDYVAELVLRTRILAELCGLDAQQSIVEVTVPLVGRGVSSRFTATPDTLDFGMVVVGDSLVRSFDLLNEGNIAGDLSSFFASSPLFEVLAPIPPETIVAGGRQAVDVQFKPDVAGVYFDSLRVATVDLCGRDTFYVFLRAEAVDPLPDLIPRNLAVAAGLALTGLRVGDNLQVLADLENLYYPVPDTFRNRFVLVRPDGVSEPVGDIVTPGMNVEILPGLTSSSFALTQAGAHQVCFDADVLLDILEVDEENNRVCIGPFDVRPLLPDLFAADLARTDGLADPITRGQTHDFTGVVRNIGDLDVSEPFRVEIRSNDQVVDFATIEALAAGAETTFTASVDFPDPGTYTLVFRVDADFGIDEILEDNNDFVLGPFEVELPDALPVAPNPFTPNEDGFNDRVAFRIAEFGLTQPVLRIFSFEGRLLRTFDQVVDGALEWDGRDDDGRELRPGVYLYTVEEERDIVATGHITLAR
ncbi:MAG: choice-of-anchor D domain-containing protein [Rhodothermales bacterium]